MTCINQGQLPFPRVHCYDHCFPTLFHQANVLPVHSTSSRQTCLHGLLLQWMRSITALTTAAGTFSTDLLLTTGCSEKAACFVQIDALQHILTAEQPGWLGFCHNDLQYGNMLLAARSSTPRSRSLLHVDSNTTQVRLLKCTLFQLPLACQQQHHSGETCPTYTVPAPVSLALLLHMNSAVQATTAIGESC